jgi:hypothetical protein
MYRRGWTSQIEYFVDLYIYGKANIVPDELEVLMSAERRYVTVSASIKVVQANYICALL